MTEKSTDIPIVILAGGMGQRMGGIDKCLLSLGDSSVLAVISKNLLSQSRHVYLNINGDASRFSSNTLPIIKDECETPIGPLGGLLSACHHVLNNHPLSHWFMTVAGDSPFLPQNLLVSLLDAAQADSEDKPKDPNKKKPEVIFCRSHERDHFIISLWSREIAPKLQHFTEQGGRSVGRFIQMLNHQSLTFDDLTIDPFFNINTQEQWLEAQAVAASSTKNQG